jgi:hypothetical protein
MKTSRFGQLILAIVLLLSLLLTACGPASTVDDFYVRRNPQYTTALDSAELRKMLDVESMTPDLVVSFVNAWAAYKYESAETSTVGYESKKRLAIPYGKVGRLQLGSHRLILPPRTYLYLPEGDDEVKILDALCVAPGALAWKIDAQGVRTTVTARDECYNEPVEGWTFENTTTIGPGSFGVYSNEDGTWRALATGTYVDIPSPRVEVYPSPIQRYKTLAVDVFNSQPNPSDPACSSMFCGTIVDGVRIAGTQRLISINIEIGFQFMDPNQNDATLAMYKNLGSARLVAGDFVENPGREATRSVCTEYTQEQLSSPEGKALCESKIADYVTGKITDAHKPLTGITAHIRSIDFNDVDLRTAATAAEVELQKQADRERIAAAQEEAINSETASLAALNTQIVTKMTSISKVINVTDGISCQELALLQSLGLVTLEWDKYPSNFCGDFTSVTVTAPSNTP